MADTTTAAPMFYSCLVGAAVQYSKHAYIKIINDTMCKRLVIS